MLYDYDKEKYDVYNEEQCNTRYSPYSTFKIVAVLEGLNDGVLISKNTKMKYNGEKYPFDMWNKDMNLNEAFQTSCVWYFRQVIDNIGQEKLKEADVTTVMSQGLRRGKMGASIKPGAD